MKSTSIVIIGRHGQLARELAGINWPQHCLPHFLGSSEINLFAAAAARSELAALRPAAMINAAAYSSVDRAEEQVEACWRLNALLPAQLASIAEALDVPLLHVSSDYVFDGRQRRPYDEEAVPHPMSTYGLSKCAGDSAVLSRQSIAHVVRTSWLFGPHGHNFLKTILTKASVSPHVPLRVVDDQIGTPTPAVALAVFLQTLALELATGASFPRVLHFSGAQPASWHDFTATILDTFHRARVLATRPQLTPISTATLASAAQRPSYSALDCHKAAALGYDVPDWESSLQALAGYWKLERKVA